MALVDVIKYQEEYRKTLEEPPEIVTHSPLEVPIVIGAIALVSILLLSRLRSRQ